MERIKLTKEQEIELRKIHGTVSMSWLIDNSDLIEIEQTAEEKLEEYIINGSGFHGKSTFITLIRAALREKDEEIARLKEVR